MSHIEAGRKGRLEIALNHEAPKSALRLDERRGSWFSVRPDDYMRLCRSHHTRYDKTGYCR